MAINKRSVSLWPIALIGIFIFSIALYLPSMMGGAIWDDDDLISGKAFGMNTFLSAFTKPFLGHYFRPLTSASFVLDSSFAKQTPFFYHQTNVLLHAITAVLIACLAILITKKQMAGILAGLFFATQPLQVGAAAWIGGRTDVLSAMFLAAFMVTLVQYHQTKKVPWLIASTVTFFLASLAKEQALFVLPAVPLSVFAFGSKNWKDAWKLCRPFGVAVVLFVILWVIDAPAPYSSKATLVAAVTLFLRTAAHYGLAWLTPNNRSILSFTLENYRGLPWIAAGAVIFGGFVYFLKICWKDHRPVAWVAICGFLVYVPISNFPPVPSFVLGPYRCAESGTAVACLFGVIAAYAITNRKYVLALAMAANMVAGTVVTWWGIHQWNNPLNLFKTVANIDPHFIIGVGNYAHALDLDNRPKEELFWTNRLLTWMFATDKWKELLIAKKQAAFTPDVIERLKTNGGLVDLKGLGWFISCYAGGLEHLKRHSEAIKIEEVALIVAPRDPRIHFAYGQMILTSNRPLALRHWEMALKETPKFSACAAALAHERVIDHQYAAAVKLLEPAVADLGWDSGTWIDLAKAKIGLGDLNGAKAALKGAGQAIYVKKEQIDPIRKQIEDLEHPAPSLPKK